jgi:molybdopterin synthase sulfur carrier subunit
MPEVVFTRTLLRHLPAPTVRVDGATVREVLEAALRPNPSLRAYILDDQGRLRRHVTIFVDGEVIADRDGLGDPVRADGSVFVMQALSGGSEEVT